MTYGIVELSGYPLAGWRLKGKLVHPPAAYTDKESWLSNFEANFPDKSKKMHDYSDKQGWHKPEHVRQWFNAVLRWLQKNAEAYQE